MNKTKPQTKYPKQTIRDLKNSEEFKLKQLAKEVDNLAIQKSKKYGDPVGCQAVNTQGQKMAGELKANKLIVYISTRLLDIEIAESLAPDEESDHLDLASELKRKILKKYKLSKKDEENIQHCVTAHHGGVKHKTIEAEICANADCYRFLTLKGLKEAEKKMAKEFPQPAEMKKFLASKFYEKKSILSLPSCQHDLKDEIKKVEAYLQSL